MKLFKGRFAARSGACFWAVVFGLLAFGERFLTPCGFLGGVDCGDCDDDCDVDCEVLRL